MLHGSWRVPKECAEQKHYRGSAFPLVHHCCVKINYFHSHIIYAKVPDIFCLLSLFTIRSLGRPSSLPNISSTFPTSAVSEVGIQTFHNGKGVPLKCRFQHNSRQMKYKYSNRVVPGNYSTECCNSIAAYLEIITLKSNLPLIRQRRGKFVYFPTTERTALIRSHETSLLLHWAPGGSS